MKLKPCPFCGNEVQAVRDNCFVGGIKTKCEVCNFEDEWFSVDSWNHRAIEDTLQARITELEAYADKLAAGLSMLPKDIENIRQANESMAQRINELETAERWISVKRRLPEETGMYLVVSVDRETNKPWVMMMFYGFKVFQGLAEVTHWMPLPNPPSISDRTLPLDNE